MGNPTPGSGGVSSLMAMASAKLARTVAVITVRDKYKPKYNQWISDFNEITTDIDSRIFPELKGLFQHDTDRFKEYMRVYGAWKRAATDEQQKVSLKEMQDRLKIVTESALSIAKLSNDLCKYGSFAFDHVCGSTSKVELETDFSKGG